MRGGSSKPRSPRTKAALAELEQLVRQHYPDATFSVYRAYDDCTTWDLVATVDADPQEVLDVVLDRVIEMQMEDLPVQVTPVHTPEYNARQFEAYKRRMGRPATSAAAANGASARQPSSETAG